MVRNYKRIKEKGYTDTQLKKAVEDVKNNKMTSSQAANLYGIPRTTINTRLRCVHEAAGRPTVFSAEFEKQMAQNLHIMEKHGFPLTRKEASVLISEYVRQNGIISPFKDGIPGKDWFHAFQKRNNLSIKKPQNIEYARRKACDPFIIYGYFEMLETVVEELGLKGKPKQIYNLDETSISNDPSKGKIVGKKGFKSTRTTSGPGRNNTTVLFATNACGDKIPPLIIFQGKYLWQQWLYANENVKTAYAVSAKGWMETSIFERYIRETFVPAIGTERPVLLILDGHSTHVDLKVIEYAASQEITILKLPPHSSHILQPLDCSAMKPLKDRWEDEIIKWQRLHIGGKLPKSEFARIVTKIWDEINPVILTNGFRKAGAYPVDSGIIPKELFDFKVYQKWENFKTQQNQTLLDSVQIDESGNKTNQIPSLLSLALEKINKIRKVSLRNNSKASQAENVQQGLKSEERVVKQEKKKDQNKDALNEQTEGLKMYGKAKNNQIETIKRKEKENQDKNKDGVTSENIILNRERGKLRQYPNNKKTRESHLMNLKQEYGHTVTAANFKLQIPSKYKDIKPQSSLKILDIKTIEPLKTDHENTSFEKILLQTIAKNDPPVHRKKRVNNSEAEVLTYKHVLERMKKEKAEKDIIQQNKLKRKMAKDVKKKENNIQKKKAKKQVITKKKIQRKINHVSDDSNSTGSYKSIDDSDNEVLETFYESLLENDLQYNDKDDRVSENNFDTDDYSSQTTRATSHYCCNTEASTSKENSKVFLHPEEGQFILAKFYSSNGKKTFKYVCLVENVSDEKLVVLGLKSKNKKNVFNIIENDLSIIENKDIVQVLPNPEIRDKDYVFPCKIEILEW